MLTLKMLMRWSFSKLGWKSIPCITVTSEFEHAYGSIQANQTKLSGNERLGAYLNRPTALLQRQASSLGAS